MKQIVILLMLVFLVSFAEAQDSTKTKPIIAYKFGTMPLKPDSVQEIPNQTTLSDSNGIKYVQFIVQAALNENGQIYFVNEQGELLLKIPSKLLIKGTNERRQIVLNDRLAYLQQFINFWNSVDRAIEENQKLLQIQRDLK